MKITNTKERVVTIEPCDGGFLLVERVRYLPRGDTRGKWDEARIWLSPEELQKLQETRQTAEGPVKDREAKQRLLKALKIGDCK